MARFPISPRIELHCNQLSSDEEIFIPGKDIYMLGVNRNKKKKDGYVHIFRLILFDIAHILTFALFNNNKSV